MSDERVVIVTGASGGIGAWLTLHAPREWSGVFMDYDDRRVAGPAAKLSGNQQRAPEPQHKVSGP